MPLKKITLSKKEKAIIIDLILKGYPRTTIAKKTNMKNITLERLCKENNINLNPKYCSVHIKYNTSGIVIISNKNIYFSNLNQLYLLLILEQCPNVHNITAYDETYKIIKNNKIEICFIDKNKIATNTMIRKAIKKKIIRFMSSYYNKKFGVKEWKQKSMIFSKTLNRKTAHKRRERM